MIRNALLISLLLALPVRAIVPSPIHVSADCRGIGNERWNGVVVPNRVIVQFMETKDRQTWFSELRKLISKDDVVRPIDGTNAFVIDSPTKTTAQLIERLAPAKDLFSAVAEDALYEGHQAGPLPTNDEDFESPAMWGLRAIHAPEAWAHGQGSSCIIAAIVDSGVFIGHEDLVDNVWIFRKPFRTLIDFRAVRCFRGDFGYDAIGNDCQPEDRSHHGTRVAGIIGAKGNNEKDIVGVNWVTTLLPVAFLDESNSGCESRAAKALEFVHRFKKAGLGDLRVVNLSWGSNRRSRLIERQLRKLANDGIVIVASAGNDSANNDDDPMYPASNKEIPTLIGVAATNRAGFLWPNSNYSEKLVDIAAPGEEVLTTNPTLEVKEDSGTSMSAAFVTGAVALIASQCPDLTALQLKEIILENADVKQPLFGCVTKGRFLNVEAAADACANRRCPSFGK